MISAFLCKRYCITCVFWGENMDSKGYALCKHSNEMKYQFNECNVFVEVCHGKKIINYVIGYIEDEI